MSISSNQLHRLPPQQRGAVLIVGLIMLFIMTLISVSSISGSLLETRMSSNYRDRQVAFQAAEAALRRGERLTANYTVKADFDASCTNGLCDADIQAGVRTKYWLDTTVWSNSSKYITFSVAGSSEDAKIIIEYLGQKILDTTAGLQPATDPIIYRITALGYGQSVNSRVMLQSTFILPIAP